MKTNTVFAIILIFLGIAAFSYQAITYTSKEKIIDIGPVTVTAEKTKTIPLPPIVGGLALVGGILLLIIRKRR
jgi:hypothetical protein